MVGSDPVQVESYTVQVLHCEFRSENFYIVVHNEVLWYITYGNQKNRYEFEKSSSSREGKYCRQK